MLLIGVLTVVLTRPAQAQVSSFTTNQIETGTGCNWPFSSVTTSPVDGKLYAIWRRGADMDVTYKLIRWDGAGWTILSTFTTATGTTSSVKVPDFKGATDYVSMAIDKLGRFHVAFKGSLTSTDRDGVWYGLSTNGTSWSFQSLQSVPAGAVNESLTEQVLEVDAQNRPHVAFRYTIAVAPRTYTLRYFRLTDSGWVGETALTQSGSSNGGTVSNEIGRIDMSIDRNSKAHLSFRRETNGTGRDGGLNYITNASGSWSAPLEIVSGATDASQAVTNTIETDANNKVHIVHSDYQSKLYYTTNISGSFVTNQINGNLTGDTRLHTLSINGNGDKFVVYNDDISIPTQLNYAYQLAGTSGATWTTGTAFTPAIAGKGGNYYSGILTNERRIMLLFDNLANGNENCGASNTRNFRYATATVQAPSTPAPSFTQSPASTAVCGSGTVTLTATATGATSFNWEMDDNAAFSSPMTLASGGVFTIATSGTTSTLSINYNGSFSGRYFRAVATNSGGTTNSGGALLTVNPLPTVSITGLATAYCKDAAAVTLTGSPPGGSFTIDGNGATQFDPANLATGSHTVRYSYTNGNGCSNTTTQLVRVKATPPVPTLLTQTGQSYPGSQSAVTVDLNTGTVTLLIGGCSGTSNWSGPNNAAGTSNAISVPTGQPGTFVYQATCTSDGCTSPTASATVSVGGRLTLLQRDVDNYADNNAIQPLLQILNQGSGPLSYSAITLRYYLTVEGAAALSNLSVNYAQVGNGNVRLRYVPLSPTQPGAAGYVEYSFTPQAGDLAAGANSGTIQTYFAKADYSGLYEPDDYSYAPVRDQLIATQRITAYYNGVLIAGVEPGTPMPAIRAVRALTESKNGPSATQINTYLEVRNEGTVALNYSDLKVRYYFTADGNERLQVEVDEGQVQTRLVRLPAPLAGADTYLELSFTQSGQLMPGSSTGTVRYRIVKPDGGRFNQANDYSYQEQPAERSQNSRVVVYGGQERLWGTLPSGASTRSSALVAEAGTSLSVHLLGNPIVGGVVEAEVRGAQGQPLTVQLTDLQGRVLSHQTLAAASAIERLELTPSPSTGLLLLQVSTPTQRQTLKVLKAE